MQKLNLRMQKRNFPGTHWRGLALIGAQKNLLNPSIAEEPQIFKTRSFFEFPAQSVHH